MMEHEDLPAIIINTLPDLLSRCISFLLEHPANPLYEMVEPYGFCISCITMTSCARALCKLTHQKSLAPSVCFVCMNN